MAIRSRIDLVLAGLELDETYRPWLTRLGAVPPGPDLTPLEPGATSDLLGGLGVDAATVSEVVGTLPSPSGDPERWWLLQRCHWLLAATMGDVTADVGRWPDLPPALGARGRCFPFHWYAATVPLARRWHATHGLSEEVSTASLADLGRHSAIGRLVAGVSGLDAPWWMTHHVRAVLYEVGGLQYVPYRLGAPCQQPDPWYTPAMAAALGPGFGAGDDAVALHVPAGAPLDAASVERSMGAAADLLDRVVPGTSGRLATCSSWLLDEGLAALLPAGSSILSFAGRFQLVPGGLEADRAVVGFVFTKRGVAPTRAGAQTRLQRGVLDHLGAGRHFSWRTGWCRLRSLERPRS